MIDTDLKFEVPKKENVSSKNREILNGLEDKLGFIPNIYATYAYSENALSRYMNFSGGKTSLNNKEKEVVNLVVSQVNGCTYCQAAHTAAGKSAGFDEDQILEIRKGKASFNEKLDVLARLAKAIIEKRGQVDDDVIHNFFEKGYDKENLVDLILAVGDKTMTNMLHNVTHIPIDFPEAPEL